MNVLVAHNFYQIRGGEDQVYEDTCNLLTRHGHQVTRFTVHNDDLSAAGKLSMAKNTIWNRSIAKQIRRHVERDHIQVAHFINTFPQISPAAYYAARRAGAAVIQDLPNFRFFCPAALFLRDGKVCEDCIGQTFPMPAVRHKCYRGSGSATAVVATMLATHRLLGTYRKAVDQYSVLTTFSRDKFVQAGLPAEKLFIRPNFVWPDPSEGPGGGGYALFVGRLSPEKGVDVLLNAWAKSPGIPLKIVGDGPLADQVKQASASNHLIHYVGRKPVEQVMQLMGDAEFLLFPSVWYEGQPKTILESLAKGTPIIASKIGAMIDLIDHGKTGLHVPPGDADALVEAVKLLASDASRRAAMRIAARETYLRLYTADENYRQLMHLYDVAIQKRREANEPNFTPFTAH
jgi:glycosyltransferase involved in cell wall biosynthesis